MCSTLVIIIVLTRASRGEHLLTGSEACLVEDTITIFIQVFEKMIIPARLKQHSVMDDKFV